jgi:hypothetical protein
MSSGKQCSAAVYKLLSCDEPEHGHDLYTTEVVAAERLSVAAVTTPPACTTLTIIDPAHKWDKVWYDVKGRQDVQHTQQRCEVHPHARPQLGNIGLVSCQGPWQGHHGALAAIAATAAAGGWNGSSDLVQHRAQAANGGLVVGASGPENA